MNFYTEFTRLMGSQTELALATSVNNSPNVRVVNFYYDNKKNGIVYFATFSDNLKIAEFYENDKVAFTTITTKDIEHVRVTNGQVIKSELSIFDLKDEFSNKIPNYDTTIKVAGECLDLYEIHFNEATVTIDLEHIETITL